MRSRNQPASTDAPRLMGLAELANYLGVKPAALPKLITTFKKIHFPQPLPQFGLYDRKVIDLWLDRLSGITTDGRFGFHPPEYFRIGSPFAPVKRAAGAIRERASTNPYTVAEAIDSYAAYTREHTTSITRVQWVSNATILPHFGHRTVDSLNPAEIRAWHEAIAKSPKVKRVGFGQARAYCDPPKTPEEIRRRKMTANGHLMVLKAALNLAFREGKVTSDAPWRAVPAFKNVHNAHARYLTVEECQRLIPLLAPDFRDLARAAIYTGARLMELTCLVASDFNEEAGTVHFKPGKNRTGRHVILNDEGARFFASRTENLHKSDLIFRRGDGEKWRPTDASHRLLRPVEVAGLDHITFHSFRHTYASMMIQAGASISAVAKNLGHKQTEICERYYAHLRPSFVASEIRGKMPSLNLSEGTVQSGT